MLLIDLQRRAGNSALASLMVQGTTRTFSRERFTVQRAPTFAMEGAETTAREVGLIKPIAVDRPTSVEGMITNTVTSDRGKAPEPTAVKQIATEVGKKPAEVWTALFAGTHDRGHIMGLQLGGIDDPQNIVPQFSLNQQSGIWRGIETNLLKSPGMKVRFDVSYPSEEGTYHDVIVPNGISVSGAAVNNWANAQDVNDFRKMHTGPEQLQEAYAEVLEKNPQSSPVNKTAAVSVAKAVLTQMLRLHLIHNAEVVGKTVPADFKATGKEITKRKQEDLLERLVANKLVVKDETTGAYTFNPVADDESMDDTSVSENSVDFDGMDIDGSDSDADEMRVT